MWARTLSWLQKKSLTISVSDAYTIWAFFVGGEVVVVGRRGVGGLALGNDSEFVDWRRLGDVINAKLLLLRL